MISIQEYFSDPEWSAYLESEGLSFANEEHNCANLQKRAEQLTGIIGDFREHVKSIRGSGVDIQGYDSRKITRYLRNLKKIHPDAPEASLSMRVENALKATGFKGSYGETDLQNLKLSHFKHIKYVFNNVLERFVNRATQLLNDNSDLLVKDYTQEHTDCYTYDPENKKPNANLFMVVLQKIQCQIGKGDGGIIGRVSPIMSSPYSDSFLPT